MCLMIASSMIIIYRLTAFSRFVKMNRLHVGTGAFFTSPDYTRKTENISKKFDIEELGFGQWIFLLNIKRNVHTRTFNQILFDLSFTNKMTYWNYCKPNEESNSSNDESQTLVD